MNDSTQEARELRGILDTMADGVYVIDGRHVIRRWNGAMERLTGYSAREAVGQSCNILRTEDNPEAGMGMVENVLSREGLVRGEEVMIRRKDGLRVPMLVNARTMPGASGCEGGAVITFTDISAIKRLEEENRQLRLRAGEALGDLVGRSQVMQEVFHLIELAAASDETVLVSGETGTGKELVARAIHRHSTRKDGPLVIVNCSALSESLLESELFGHVKGAFTGALRDYTGRFESARQGSIFLDEIGDLPPLVQVKLLRVLQERTIERVGEGLPRTVDVRVIAATHRDLRTLVNEGGFRQDLFYRLNVFPIRIPPLRERREDIALLLAHFTERFRKRTGKDIQGFAPDALRMMMDHCWPGNVRELENAVAHAFVTCSGGTAGPFDLPLELRRVDVRQRLCEQETPAEAPQAVAQVRPAGRLTKSRLIEALTECGWNKAEAARRLGVDRTTIWRRMKALGVAMTPPEVP